MVTKQTKKPTIAVYKFSSCDGCQLNILNLEDELLDLVGVVELAYFLEARRQMLPGPYDIALVEGSVSTPEEVERIKEIRRNCGILVALGTCATAGGVQALRNFGDVKAFTEIVYQHPEYIDSLPTSSRIADHVKVDLELWGCPVNKYEVLEALVAVLQNRRPNLPQYSLCLECKRQGLPCVMVAYGMPCLGPIVRSGCGALCPSNGRGCYGCFGPLDTAEIDAFVPVLQAHQRYPGEAVRLLRTISGNAPLFVEAAEMIEKQESSQEEA
jgi:coenzyme F420-reducing hydrogenase gamma subunit